LALLALGAQAALLPALPAKGAVKLADLLGLLRVRVAVTGLIATALIAVGHFAAYTYLEPFLVGVTGLSPSYLGYTLAGYGLAGMVGTLIGERAMAYDARLAFAGAAGCVGGAILLTAQFGASPVVAVLLIVLWGAAFGAIPVCVQIWLFHAAPDRFEGGSALMVTVFQLALSLGAWSGGVVVDSAGLQTAFLTGGVMALLCAALILLAGKTGATSRPIRA
jgi:predicted MFS family arabinose efflux permease